jgi:hypothetical protein
MTYLKTSKNKSSYNLQKKHIIETDKSYLFHSINHQ